MLIELNRDDTEARDTAVTRERRRAALYLLVLAALIGVVGPLAVAAWSGSLSIPHNDAWAFSKAAQTFARTGHIRLLNWNSMSLVGLFVPLGPLGASIAAQQCYVAVLGLVGLLAGFDVLRRDVGVRRAAVGVLVLISWPGFGLLSTSMMTDVPAFTALAVSLALGRRALERNSWWLWTLWTAVSFWGFTVREQTIVAPIAVLGLGLARRDWRNRRTLVLSGIGGVLLVADAVFEHWRKTLHGGGSPSGQIHFPGLERLLTMGSGMWLLLALFLSPLIILTVRPRRWSWPARLAAVLSFAVLATAVIGFHTGLAQDYFERQGAYPTAFLGDKPDLFPAALWDVLLAFALVAGALLMGTIVHRLRSLPMDLAIVFVLTVAGTLLELLAGQILFDRYLLPAVLPLAALLLREPIGPRPRTIPAAATWFVLTVMTSLTMLNALTYDAATWKAAHSLVTSGAAKASAVNAGFAWSAYFSTTGARGADPKAEVGTFKQTPLFSDDQPCYVIAASPQTEPGWTLTATPDYLEYGFIGPTGHLYVYRTAESSCAP